MTINIGFISGLCFGAAQLVHGFFDISSRTYTNNELQFKMRWSLSSPLRWSLSGMITQIGLTTLLNVKDDRSITGSLSLAFTVGEIAFAINALERANPQLVARIKYVASLCFERLTDSCCK